MQPEALAGGGGQVVLLPRLGDLRAVGLQFGLAEFGRAHDGNVAGFAGVGAGKGGQHQAALVGQGLGLAHVLQRLPAGLLGGGAAQPGHLGRGEQDLAVLWWPEYVDALLLGKGPDKGAAMAGAAVAPVFAAAVGFSGLPVDMLTGQPEVVDAGGIELGRQGLAGAGDRAAAGLALGGRL